MSTKIVKYEVDTDDVYPEDKVPREPVFGPEARQPTIAYDRSDVKRSIYRGRWETPHPHFDDHRLEHIFRLRCLQGWFYRCSWSEKFSFIVELSDLTTGTLVLEQVLKCVDLIQSKDVADSFARDRIRFAYDLVPTDDNRALAPPDMQMAKQEDAVWFVGLDTSAQVDVLVKLMKLGGGGLIYRACGEIDRLYRQRKEIDAVLAAVGHAIRELGGDDKETTREVVKEDAERMENPSDSYTARRIEQVTRRNSELAEFKKRYGLVELPNSKSGNGKNGNGKRKEPPETIDHLQMLPLWVNRRIMVYLKEKELTELKKTGKYWAKMIEDAVRESCGRSNLNARIGKMSGGSSVGRTEAEADEASVRHIPTAGREALLRDLHLRKGDLIRAGQESERFRRRKFQVRSWEGTAFARICCDINESCKLLAASTPNKTIQFHYLRTGARTGNLVTGLQSHVTSLVLHDDGFHVVAGFESGALTCFDMRKNMKTISYKGHSGVVFRVHVSDDKLVSVSEDRTVKYFDLWSGLCLLCVNVEAGLTSAIVTPKGKDPETVVAGTSDGKLILINLKRKKIYDGIQVHDKEVKAMTEKGDLLVTAGGDRAVRLWNMRYFRCKSDALEPYWDTRVGAPATALLHFHAQVYAACTDGKLVVMCLLTGAKVREIEVTHRRPIAGVHVVHERGRTSIIVWHEKGIEERSFTLGGLTKNKSVKSSWDRLRAKTALTRRKLFSLLPSDAIHYTLPLARKVKRYKAMTADDREKVVADRSCTVDAVRTGYAADCTVIRHDVFTEMVSKFELWPIKEHDLVTFPRLKRREISTDVLNISNTSLD